MKNPQLPKHQLKTAANAGDSNVSITTNVEVMYETRYCDQGLYEEISTILNAWIAPSTHSGQNSMKIHLIFSLQDHCKKFPNIINLDLMGRLVVVDDKDHQHRTKVSKPSKPKLWDYSKQAIDDIFGKINQDDPSTFPIDFKNFTFNGFAAFLKTFTKNYKVQHTQPCR